MNAYRHKPSDDEAHAPSDAELIAGYLAHAEQSQKLSAEFESIVFESFDHQSTTVLRRIPHLAQPRDPGRRHAAARVKEPIVSSHSESGSSESSSFPLVEDSIDYALAAVACVHRASL